MKGRPIAAFALLAAFVPGMVGAQTRFSEAELFAGTRATPESCARLPYAVWIVVDGTGDCIRYFSAGLAAGANPKVIVYLHGDRLAGTRMRNTLVALGGYRRASAEAIESQVAGWAKNAGLPYIFFARPGTYGSSGDHTQRRRAREIALSNAAFDAIKMRHAVGRFTLAGQSGGGFLTAALLAERTDIACAALSSAPASLKLRTRLIGAAIDTTGYINSVDPSESVVRIPRDPRPRIFIIGDPRDTTVPHASQIDYFEKLRAAGQTPVRIDGVAPPRAHHSLDEHGRTAAMMCMNARSDADIVARLAALNARGVKAETE